MTKIDRLQKNCAALTLSCLITFAKLFTATAAEVNTDASVTAAGPSENNIDERVFPRTPGYALMGAGGVLLLTGIVTGSVALKINSDLNDNCPQGACYKPYHNDVDRLETLAAVTDVFLPLSAVLLISGSALYLLSRKTEKKYGGDPAKPKKEERRLSFTSSSVIWRF